MNIIYPKIEEYNKENFFYDYIENYIREFKNKKDKIELSYLCAKEVIELIKENKELYQNFVKCLELVKLWLKDENLIDIKELEEITDSIYFNCYSNSAFSIYYSANSIYYSINAVYCAYSVYYTYLAKPELLPYIQNLIQIYLRQEKQFNITEHNNTYYESILKQIVNTKYNELSDVDKNQVIDIINEYYDIQIDCFDFLTHKTIQREFL